MPAREVAALQKHNSSMIMIVPETLEYSPEGQGEHAEEPASRGQQHPALAVVVAGIVSGCPHTRSKYQWSWSMFLPHIWCRRRLLGEMKRRMSKDDLAPLWLSAAAWHGVSVAEESPHETSFVLKLLVMSVEAELGTCHRCIGSWQAGATGIGACCPYTNSNETKCHQ